jgi:hypothetical protein
MREQGILLKEIARPPLLGAEVNAGLAVVKDTPVEDDAAFIGFLNTGDAFERQALAAAGGAEQSQDLVPGAEFYVQCKCP